MTGHDIGWAEAQLRECRDVRRGNHDRRLRRLPDGLVIVIPDDGVPYDWEPTQQDVFAKDWEPA